MEWTMRRVSWESDSIHRPVTEPDHETRATPKFDVVAVNRALDLGYGLIIVATDERLKPYEMSVITDCVGAIIRHRCSGGRCSPVRSLLISGDRNGSSSSQSMFVRPSLMTTTSPSMIA
jgi:hypothetical protein